ncbi:MAG: YIP1 family protein [Planctomycetota bacterium]
MPPLAQRVKGVLFDPVATFRELDSSWGMMGPWLAIMIAGLIYGVVAIAQVDHVGLGDQRAAYALTFRSDQQRRQDAQVEQSTFPGKAQAFSDRMGLVLGPSVGTILGVVFVGLVLFGGAATLGGKKDLVRAIVVAAHAKLVAVVLYAVQFVGLIMRNPSPATNPRNVVDEVAQPVLSAALSLFDPLALWHTALLGIGLTVSLGLRRNRAILIVSALHLAQWLGALGIAAASLAQRR